MTQFFNKKLLSLGFEQKLDTLFSLHIDTPLQSTSTTWEVFAYYEDGKYYFSNNGDLVSSFDTPDIDIEFMLTKIKYEISKYGCSLNVSKIVKEIDLKNIQDDLKDFISAVKKIDKMYNNL